MKDLRLKIAVAALSGLVAISLLFLHYRNLQPNTARADALYNEAATLMRQGKLYEAETRLDQAVQLVPEDPHYLKALAEVLKNEGDFEGAMKRYLLEAELENDNPKPLFEAGMLALRSGERDHAQQLFTDALNRAPGDIPTLYQLGFLALTNSKFDDAAHYYQRIIAKSFREPEAYRNLGFIDVQKDELDDAEQMYRNAIKYSPDNAELQNDFGNLMALRGKTDEARKAFTQALSLKPELRDAQINLDALNRSANPAAPTPAPAPSPAPGATALTPTPPSPAPIPAPAPGGTP